LFNETAGCFVIELADGADAGELFADVPCRKIGRVVSPRLFTAFYNHRRLFSVPLADLGGSWQGPMKGVFGV
jgi:phosphoribosylformylglycinamidine synthase